MEPDSHTISTMQERPDSVGFHVKSGFVRLLSIIATGTTIKEVAALDCGCSTRAGFLGCGTVGCVGHNAWILETPVHQ